MNEGKIAIWLDDDLMEVLGGYLAELLDETENGELPDHARKAIYEAYKQTLPREVN